MSQPGYTTYPQEAGITSLRYTSTTKSTQIFGKHLFRDCCYDLTNKKFCKSKEYTPHPLLRVQTFTTKCKTRKFNQDYLNRKKDALYFRICFVKITERFHLTSRLLCLSTRIKEFKIFFRKVHQSGRQLLCYFNPKGLSENAILM